MPRNSVLGGSPPDPLDADALAVTGDVVGDVSDDNVFVKLRLANSRLPPRLLSTAVSIRLESGEASGGRSQSMFSEDVSREKGDMGRDKLSVLM